MPANETDVAKSFLAELDAIDRELQQTSDAGWRDWLLGLRERLRRAARG